MTTSESSLSIQYISTEESFIDVKSTVEIPFDFRESKQVKVKENDEHLIEGQDYEVLIGLEKDDNVTHYSYKKVYGYVRMLKDIPINNVLTLYRETPKTQESEYRMHRRLDVQSIENSFDKVTMITQELGSGSAEIREDLTEAQTDILELEDRASAVETRAAALEAGLISAQSDIDDTKKRVKKAEGIVSDMHDTVSSFDSRVTDLEADAVITRERVTYTELKSNTNDSRITRLEETAITEEILDSKGYLTEHQDISHLATKEELPDISGLATKEELPDISGLATKEELPDISGLATKEEIPDISTKQDVLIAGENIKTINGVSILGEGNVTIEGGGVADYPSLTDKPSINGVELNGAITSEDLGITEAIKITYYNDTNKADKTFDEMLSYIKQGRTVFVEYKNITTATQSYLYSLLYWNDDNITFEYTLIDYRNTQHLLVFHKDNRIVKRSYGNSIREGDNILIDTNYDERYSTISAIDTKYTAGENISISEDNVISATDTKYTAGENISISSDNVISASGKEYKAGSNIKISDDNVISATDTRYANGDLVYSLQDGSYTKINQSNIKKIINNYILDTDGVLYRMSSPSDNFTIPVEDRTFGLPEIIADDVVDIFDINNLGVLYRNGNLESIISVTYPSNGGIIYNWDTIAYDVKDFKYSDSTMWYLDSNNNLWGKGDNTCNQQGMTKDERDSYINNQDWRFLFYVDDFVMRAENVDDFGCSDFGTWYKKDGSFFIAGLSELAYGVEQDSITKYYTVFQDFHPDGFVEQGNITGVSMGSSMTIAYDDHTAAFMGIDPLREFILDGLSNKDLDMNDYAETTLHHELILHSDTGFTRYVRDYTVSNGESAWISSSPYPYLDYFFPLFPIIRQHLTTKPTITTIKDTTATTTAAGFKDVITNGASTWYIDSANKLYGLGKNYYGQQGSGNTTTVTSFTARESSKLVTKVYCTYDNTYYLTLDGDLYGTGANDSFYLTNGHRYYDPNSVGTTEERITIKSFILIATNVRDFHASENNIVYFTKDNNIFQIWDKLYKIPYIIPRYAYKPDLICDGSILSGDWAPIKKTTTLYRLLNTDTEHYYQDLWTSDTSICTKENGDTSKLYRHIRRGQGNGNDEGFCNIKENISISKGKITSESGFYDGSFVVSTDEKIEADNSRIWYDKYQGNDYYNRVGYTGDVSNYYAERPADYINVGGANNIYAVNANIKISDNRWHVGVSSNTELRIGEQNTKNWTQTSIIHSSNINSEDYSRNKFSIECEFFTGGDLSNIPAILYIYRSLIVRPSNAAGLVKFYMAGYKSSSSLKWRHSDVSTDMTIKTHTKYKYKLYTSDNKTDNPDLSTNYEYTMELIEYDKFGNTTDNIQTYVFTSAYLPCNYYGNTVSNSMSTIIATETNTLNMYLDLDSIKISYGSWMWDNSNGVDYWSCYKPSFKMRTLGDMTVLPDLSDENTQTRIHVNY